MSDLELLADTMEEWSTTSGDHHMLAAAAIRQLIKLQAALQSGEASEWVIEVENGQVVMSRIGANFTGYLYTTPQPVVDPFNYVEKLCRAESMLKGKLMFERFAKRTPLENDIAVWMVEYHNNMLSAGKGGES